MERQQISFASQHRDPSLLVLTVPAEIAVGGEELSAFATPLDARRGGLLLAFPSGLLAESALSPAGGFTDDMLVGPSREFEMDMFEEDESGSVFPTGSKGSVLVADFNNAVLPLLREYDPVTDSTEEIFSFVDTNPAAMPSAAELLSVAMDWAAGDSASRVHFYSAREEPAVPKIPASSGRQPALRKAGAKRVTTASLAEQLVALTAQVAMLQATQEEQKVVRDVPPLPVSKSPPSADHAGGLTDLSMGVGLHKMPPVSLGLSPSVPRVSTPAKALQLLGPPPRTRMSPSPHQPLEKWDEPVDPLKAPPEILEHTLAQQSAALTTLVSHLIQGGDTLGLEASGATGASSSSTRGTLKREQLQQSLATGQSHFFMMLQQQICRRLQPSNVVPKTEDELNARAPSLLTYLERYGGFKGQKEAGLAMWVIAHAVDAASRGDFHMTREYLALAVMGLEQSAFDVGAWDLAYIVTLAEDPPAALFQEKMSSVTASARPFAPLIPAGLATISLAYLKEIDVLQNRRQEIRPKKGHVGKQEEDSSPSPKRRPKFLEEAEGHHGWHSLASQKQRKFRSYLNAVSSGVQASPGRDLPEACLSPCDTRTASTRPPCSPMPGGTERGGKLPVKCPEAGLSGLQFLNSRQASFSLWMSKLTTLVLKSRCSFSAFLANSIRVSKSPFSRPPRTPSLFPVPVPASGTFDRMPTGLSSAKRRSLLLRRVLHVCCMALNFWHYGGTFVSDDLAALLYQSGWAT